MKRLLLILAVIVAQLLAGPGDRVAVSAEVGRSVGIARSNSDATRRDAQVAAARHSAVQVARSRTRTRGQRVLSIVSVTTNPAARFASIIAHTPATEGTINSGRFRMLGLPNTRAP